MERFVCPCWPRSSATWSAPSRRHTTWHVFYQRFSSNCYHGIYSILSVTLCQVHRFHYSVALAFALDITGKVSWTEICPSQFLAHKLKIAFPWFLNFYYYKGAASLGQAKVVLDDGAFSSSVTRDGEFIMYVSLSLLRRVFPLNGFWNVQKTRCPRRDLPFISNLPWLLIQPSKLSICQW